MMPALLSFLLLLLPVVSAATIAVVTARWRRMWPPSACPDANSAPHMEHSCTLSLPLAAAAATLLRLSAVVTVTSGKAADVAAAMSIAAVWRGRG